jgi:hypothetical protein
MHTRSFIIHILFTIKQEYEISRALAHAEMKNKCKILSKRPEGKRLIGRPKIHRIVLKLRCDNVDWVHMPQDKHQGRAHLKLHIP